MLHLADGAKITSKKVEKPICASSFFPSLTASLPPQPPGRGSFQTRVQALRKNEQGLAWTGLKSEPRLGRGLLTQNRTWAPHLVQRRRLGPGQEARSKTDLGRRPLNAQGNRDFSRMGGGGDPLESKRSCRPTLVLGNFPQILTVLECFPRWN